MSDIVLAGKRILVVEDDYLIATDLARTLQAAGASVVGPAPSVDRALALIDAETLDAAILDVNLNGDRSFPIAEVLHARGIPFLFATGYDCDDIPAAWNGYPCVVKPMPIEAIVQLMAA